MFIQAIFLSKPQENRRKLKAVRSLRITTCHSSDTPTRATPRRAWHQHEDTSKLAHLSQPRTTVVNRARRSSPDRNEKQDSGPRRSTLERDKERDGFARIRWKETREGNTVGGARLTIETGADFPIGISVAIILRRIGNHPTSASHQKLAKQPIETLAMAATTIITAST